MSTLLSLHAGAMRLRAMIRNATRNAEFERVVVQTMVAGFAGDFLDTFGGTHTLIYASGSPGTEGAEHELLIDCNAVIKSADWAK